jgi:hypothetical protein
MIQKRPTIVGKFSTFLWNSKWVADRILLANISSKIEKHPHESEIFWFNHFLQAARDNSDTLAEKHLFAYLEEPCWHSADNLRFNRVDFDYFGIAREAAMENWRGIFKNYDPKQGNPCNWAKLKLYYGIMNKLRENGEFKNCSDWRILKCTKKGLEKALKAGGIKEENFSKYLLVWRAFNEIYTANVKNQRELPPPRQKQWEEITSYFNNFAAPEYANQTIIDVKKLLQICIKALRDKNQIRLATLDGEHPESLELEMIEESEFNSQDQIERSELSEEIIAVLGSVIASLPKDAKKMLILEHGLIKLSQQYIAQEFNIHRQYQVSRLLSRYHRTILEHLLEYLQKQYKITVDTEAINTACKQLDGWLNWYFQTRIIHKFLQTTLRSHPQLNQHIPILRWYFGSNPSIAKKVNKLSKEFKLSEPELHTKIAEVRKILQKMLQEWLQKIVNIDPNYQATTVKSSALVVEDFLVNAPYAEIK